MKENQALLVVDVQKDFLETGALPVKNGSKVVAVINEMIPKFKTVVFSQDWHPQNHVSFASNHPGKAPYESVDVIYGDQTLWPDHCVQNSEGAQFAAGLNTAAGTYFVKKGSNPEVDSYSAFIEADGITSTGLAHWLESHGIDELFVCGLATDFCVNWTAVDGARQGFKVSVVEDACRGVNVGDSLSQAFAEWKKRGIARVDSSEIS